MKIIVGWVIFQQRYTFNLDLKIPILLWEQIGSVIVVMLEM